MSTGYINYLKHPPRDNAILYKYRHSPNAPRSDDECHRSKKSAMSHFLYAYREGLPHLNPRLASLFFSAYPLSWLRVERNDSWSALYPRAFAATAAADAAPFPAAPAVVGAATSALPCRRRAQKRAIRM